MEAVHPRASGERHDVAGQSVPVFGSSPRERGTLYGVLLCHAMYRFIPARAGNALTGCCGPAGRPVHPRASGERVASVRRSISDSGSSPRERGTLDCRHYIAGVDRFIPARAGNAAGGRCSSAQASVHPRASGEQRVSLDARSSLMIGSSPRERGTRFGRFQAVLRQRFIPARAGNAPFAGSTGASGSVHPRASGERRRRPGAFPWAVGSSPRERGTRNRRMVFGLMLRFIPARAGNASRRRARHGTRTVHPRASGERDWDTAQAIVRTGSSPRERGTLELRRSRPVDFRFIPARAGNAHAYGSAQALRPVHPRASGERGEPRIGHGVAAGSSPRERGTPRLADEERDLGRFIPARAGNARRPMRER